jgi:hypothetical protein
VNDKDGQLERGRSAQESSFYFYAFVFTIGCAEFSRLVLHGWFAANRKKWKEIFVLSSYMVPLQAILTRPPLFVAFAKAPTEIPRPGKILQSWVKWIIAFARFHQEECFRLLLMSILYYILFILEKI